MMNKYKNINKMIAPSCNTDIDTLFGKSQLF